MVTTTGDWLEAQTDRLLARQRAEADVAKVIATFVTGVAAALVASALEVRPTTRADQYGARFLAISALLAVLVMLSDRLTAPHHESVLETSLLNAWSDERLLLELRVAALAAVDNNQVVLLWIRMILLAQLIASTVAASFGAYSLL